jgi:hypothetical protein
MNGVNETRFGISPATGLQDVLARAVALDGGGVDSKSMKKNVRRNYLISVFINKD